MKNRSLALVFSFFLFLFAIPNDVLAQTHCCCGDCGGVPMCIPETFGDCPTTCFFSGCNPGIFENSNDPACAGTTECDPLPVELTFFRAETVNEDEILLTWETATEKNNETFVILRGLGTELSWEPIGEINGQGTTSLPSEYEFVDQSPYPGINYYKLEQIDFDGTTAYSEIKAASISIIQNVNIWPTLAKDFVMVNFEGEDHDQKFTLEVFDLMGRQVIVKDNSSQGAIDIRNLTKGHYFVNVSMKNKRHTLRFVKVE